MLRCDRDGAIVSHTESWEFWWLITHVRVHVRSNRSRALDGWSNNGSVWLLLGEEQCVCVCCRGEPSSMAKTIDWRPSRSSVCYSASATLLIIYRIIPIGIPSGAHSLHILLLFIYISRWNTFFHAFLYRSRFRRAHLYSAQTFNKWHITIQ